MYGLTARWGCPDPSPTHTAADVRAAFGAEAVDLRRTSAPLRVRGEVASFAHVDGAAAVHVIVCADRCSAGAVPTVAAPGGPERRVRAISHLDNVYVLAAIERLRPPLGRNDRCYVG